MEFWRAIVQSCKFGGKPVTAISALPVSTLAGFRTGRAG
jgi:hypothetical protein